MGVRWRDMAPAEGMIGVSPLVLLYRFGLVVVAKDIAKDVGV